MGILDVGKELLNKAKVVVFDDDIDIDMIDFEKVCEEDEEGNISPISPSKRRIIYTISDKDISRLLDIDERRETFSEQNFFAKILDGFSIQENLKDVGEKLFLKDLKDRLTMYPAISSELAEKHFKFPPNHPKQNLLYGMCDIIPDLYVPISTFHDYFMQMKHTSFIELCASLGAKEIYLEYAEIENKSYNIDSSANIPSALGMLGLNLSLDESTSNKMNGKLAFKFSEKNKEIKDYQSEWIDTEPTWKSMKKMRIENHAESYRAEFNYSEDYGVNSKVAANCTALGINIGGSFKAIKETKLKYNVLFW